jgi:hypothetical protein
LRGARPPSTPFTPINAAKKHSFRLRREEKKQLEWKKNEPIMCSQLLPLQLQEYRAANPVLQLELWRQWRAWDKQWQKITLTDLPLMDNLTRQAIEAVRTDSKQVKAQIEVVASSPQEEAGTNDAGIVDSTRTGCLPCE